MSQAWAAAGQRERAEQVARGVTDPDLQPEALAQMAEAFGGGRPGRASLGNWAVDAEDIQHELVCEAMYGTCVGSGVEITTLADIPSAGSGLGSSSAVTVGLLNALFAYQGRQVTARELAERACTIEIDRCRKPIGKQDQYAAAFGGICDLRFGPGDRVDVEQIILSPQMRRLLSNELLLFYTGITRSANAILGEQSANTADRLPQLAQLRDLASEAADGLSAGDVEAVGVAMNKSWEAKRMLASGVTNSQIDEAVDGALAAGATGAKVTGAGGGGFILVICPLERQRAVRNALSHMQELPIKVDPSGSRVVFNVHRDIWS